MPRPTDWTKREEEAIPFVAPTPLHRNVYYLPHGQLDEFMRDHVECAEIVVDVRPLTVAKALAELERFRRRHGAGGKP